MTVLKTSDLNDNATLVRSVIAEVNKASAFQTVSQQLPLTPNGSIITSLGRSDASWVAEGAAKPVNNPALDQLTLTGHKLAKIVYVSKEFADDYSLS